MQSLLQTIRQSDKTDKQFTGRVYTFLTSAHIRIVLVALPMLAIRTSPTMKMTVVLMAVCLPPSQRRSKRRSRGSWKTSSRAALSSSQPPGHGLPLEAGRQSQSYPSLHQYARRLPWAGGARAGRRWRRGIAGLRGRPRPWPSKVMILLTVGVGRARCQWHVGNIGGHTPAAAVMML